MKFADRRLYWTADRQRLVETGSPEAAYLAYAPGHKIAAGDEHLVPDPPEGQGEDRPEVPAYGSGVGAAEQRTEQDPPEGKDPAERAEGEGGPEGADPGEAVKQAKPPANKAAKPAGDKGK